jgi:ribosomal protein S18 acetylase RimI-like enzyme
VVYIRAYQPSDLEPLVSLINTADSIDQAGMRTTVAAFGHSHGAVLPDHRRRGIGTALFRFTLAAMLSVEADNPTPAMAMYQRSGFNEWRRAVLYHSPPL